MLIMDDNYGTSDQNYDHTYKLRRKQEQPLWKHLAKPVRQRGMDKL